MEGLDLIVRVLILACQGHLNAQVILIFKGLVILIADLKYGAPTVSVALIKSPKCRISSSIMSNFMICHVSIISSAVKICVFEKQTSP